MSISFSSTETCPCSDGSLPQLLRTAKEKLQDIMLGEKYVLLKPQSPCCLKFLRYDTCRVSATMNQSEVSQRKGGTLDLYTGTHACGFQVDALEGDAFEVLRLVRAIKNSLAPISRIPPEVFSFIPDHFCEDDGGYYKDDMDQDLVAMTHVCRGWRNTLTSLSSLWTHVEFRNVDKTRTYIQRSESSPLKLYLGDDDDIHEAFPLIIPHIGRLKSLTADTEALPTVLQHFRRHTPLLEKLDIYISQVGGSVVDGALFNGDLSSLRELRLCNISTDFPWKNLANLRVVDFKPFSDGCGTTQFLDLFESAPLLHTVILQYWHSDSSDVPPERIVPLRHLKFFSICTSSPHPTLLRHLHIPAGASFTSEFHFHGDESPILGCLPERSSNFNNLSHITAINLLFDSMKKFVQLSGPSGSLRVLGNCRSPYDSAPSILRSIGPPILSTTQRLTISEYTRSRPHCAILQTLSFMNQLRTLVLIDCKEEPFIHSLDPENHPSVPCFNMEKIILYLRRWDTFDVEHLTRMAKNRASRGAKLSLITIVSRNKLPLEREVERLREHVTRVVCRIDERGPPAWDDLPGEGGGSGYRFGV